MQRSAKRGLLVALLAVGLVSPGCRSAAERAAPGAPIRLVYWPPPNRFDIAMSRRLVAAWNRSHPGIQVELQPLPAGRSSEEVLLAAIVGKTTPDICSNILSGTVERMVRAGALVPLSRASPDAEAYLRQRLPDGALESFRHRDGRLYQLPWKANPMMLFINLQHFAEAGIGRPRTHTEFLDAARRLTRDTDGDGRVDRWAIGLHTTNVWWKRFDDLYPLYLAASGGRTLIASGQVLFDGPPMVETLRFLRELFARGYAPRSYFAAEMFPQGRVAMVAGSAPSIPDIESRKLPGLRYGLLPMPVPDGHRGPRYTFADIKSMVLFRSCRHPAAAWAFMKYLTSAAADLTLLTEGSQIPLRRGLLRDEPFAGALRARPLLAELARRAEHVRGTDDSVHLVEIFDILSQAYEGAALHGLLTPEAAVAKAAGRVRRLLEHWD